MAFHSTASRIGFAATLMVGLALSVPALAQDAATPKVSFTAAQVSSGAAEYKRSCLDCHGANLNDGEFGGPPLKGTSFQEHYFGTTVDALYGFISAAMPPDRPGRLSPETYAALTAFILSKNGIAPGGAALPTDPDAQGELMVE